MLGRIVLACRRHPIECASRRGRVCHDAHLFCVSIMVRGMHNIPSAVGMRCAWHRWLPQCESIRHVWAYRMDRMIVRLTWIWLFVSVEF